MQPEYDENGRLTKHGELMFRWRLEQQANLPEPGSGGSGFGAYLLIPLLLFLYAKYAVNSMPPWGYWTVVFGVPFLLVRQWFKRNTTVYGPPKGLLMQCAGAMPVLGYGLHWVLQLHWQEVVGYYAWLIFGGLALVAIAMLAASIFGK